MAIYKKLANALAPQIGAIQGAVESQIRTEASKQLDKFTNSCPAQEELVKVIKVRNTLTKNLSSIQKRAGKIALAAKLLEPPILLAQGVIFLLKLEPTPASTQTSGALTTRASRIYQAELLVDNLEADIKAIKSFSDSIGNSLGSTIETLESIDLRATECAEELGTSEEIASLLNEVQPPENTGSEGTPNESYLYRGVNGKDYTLAIIEDTSEPGPIPRRVAVAKDKIGVIVLRGQPSFSSDTQVLLDELKFRIDNQLP